MFQEKIRSLLAELSANWLRRRKAPATMHKGQAAANDTKRSRPQKDRQPNKPGKPVDRASGM